MAVKPQLYWIGVNAYSYITNEQGEKKLTWGKKTSWKTFKRTTPSSTKKVFYNLTSKTKNGNATGWRYNGLSAHGSVIPSTAQRTINGVTRTVKVRYRLRGKTVYIRPKEMTIGKIGRKYGHIMTKKVYSVNKGHPYQYQIQYQDKEVYYPNTVTKTVTGLTVLHFADHYWAKKTINGKKQTVKVKVNNHLPHPVEYDLSYIDIRKNVNTDNANNGDGRDNSGTYIARNVRPNVCVINAVWQGLTIDQGKQLLSVLNPNVTTKTGNELERPYLSIQYRDPATNRALTKVFIVSDRNVQFFPNGRLAEVAVTFEEV